MKLVVLVVVVVFFVCSVPLMKFLMDEICVFFVKFEVSGIHIWLFKFVFFRNSTFVCKDTHNMTLVFGFVGYGGEG